MHTCRNFRDIDVYWCTYVLFFLFLIQTSIKKSTKHANSSILFINASRFMYFFLSYIFFLLARKLSWSDMFSHLQKSCLEKEYFFSEEYRKYVHPRSHTHITQLQVMSSRIPKSAAPSFPFFFFQSFKEFINTSSS